MFTLLQHKYTGLYPAVAQKQPQQLCLLFTRKSSWPVQTHSFFRRLRKCANLVSALAHSAFTHFCTLSQTGSYIDYSVLCELRSQSLHTYVTLNLTLRYHVIRVCHDARPGGCCSMDAEVLCRLAATTWRPLAHGSVAIRGHFCSDARQV